MPDQLKEELKTLIIETLNLEDLTPEEIDENEPLFGGSLDLDSIDGLELVLQLEKKYQIKIGSSEQSKDALKSISVLAEYIRSHSSKVV